MKSEISKLRKGHVDFKKLLDLLDSQIELLHRGELPDHQLMMDIIYYMTQYLYLIYHPRVEAIFSLLTARDPSTAENIRKLSKQLRMIEETGANFYEELEKIINDKGEIKKLWKIEAPGHQYSSSLRAIIDKEEQNIFVLAEQVLNDNDWKKVRTEAQTKLDPITVKDLEDRFHLVFDKLEQSVSTT